MMISCPYMVFRIRYSDGAWAHLRNRETYLFYDTRARQLYELPYVDTRKEITEQQEHPIRHLPNATPIGPRIHISNPREFAHDKEVRSILQEKYPKMLKLQGMGRNLIVSHELGKIEFHATCWDRGDLVNSRRSNLFDVWPGVKWGWEKRFGRARESTEIRDTVDYNMKLTEDVSVRGWNDSSKMIPQPWRKRQVYEFRTVKLFGTKEKPIFMITETKLENDGRSKRGRLSYWNWCSFWGTGVRKIEDFIVPMRIERTDRNHGVCYVNDMVQHTPEELLDTIEYYTVSIPLLQTGKGGKPYRVTTSGLIQ